MIPIDRVGHLWNSSIPPCMHAELIKASNVEKSLVIVISSKLVKRGNFLDALNERLSPPMVKAGETPALETFKSQFDRVNFRKGLQISFTFSGGRLITKADGKELGSLGSRALSETLMDIYLGNNPVSPVAKAAFGQGLASMITA
jgi:hypothetical protein